MNSTMHRDTQRMVQPARNTTLFNGVPSLKQQKATPRFSPIGPDSMLPPGQQMNNLFQNQPLALNGDSGPASPTLQDDKRKLLDDQDALKPFKKQRTEDVPPATAAPGIVPTLELEPDTDDANAPAPVPASKEGLAYFGDNDVLSGRGGGTNVHPGNRNFRDLINIHRRAYLKARKNDKPAISRAIVRAIRENNGRFLKKDEKSGLWYEIGDDAAREKTSQALRQRAPEMRKLLFDTEREEARVAAEEHLRQQRMLMGGMSASNMMQQNMGNMMGQGMNEMQSSQGMMNPALLQAMAANKNVLGNQGSDNYAQMFSAAILQGGINRFTPNGA